MKSKRISCRCVLMMLVVSVLFFCGAKAHAVPTKQLSYQGRLNNASGQPVPDGTYTIVFSIYNAATGGAPLWTETQNVSVANGGFSVYLGSVTPITLPFNEDYFLGLKVASDTEMTPRLKLSVVGASAYSLEAEKLQGKAASDFALATHTHTGLSATTVNGYSVSATPAASTLLPLDSGAKFPTSVLNVGTTTGTIAAGDHTHTASGVTQIVAGTNVTISPAGGTGAVTINSTPATGFVQLTPSSAQTMQSTADVTPLIIKDDTAGTTANLFDVQDSAGTSLVKVSGAGNLLVGNPTTTTAKVSAYEAGTGYVIYAEKASVSGDAFMTHITNATNGNVALRARTDGTGIAGYFNITNVSNISPLIVGNNTGTGNLLQLQQNSTDKLIVNNAGNLLVGNPTFTTAKVSAYETGTANEAGVFQVNNVSNAGTGVYAITNGTGSAIYANNTGTGKAGRFEINNATNGSASLYGGTGGTGRAAWFWISNTTSSASASYAQTDGTGIAGQFFINNASNPNAIIFGLTTGTGPLLQLQSSGGVNQLVVANNGKLTFSTGANKAVGTGAIAPATNSITIANTAVTASSLIFLTINNTTGTVTMPLKVGTITAGVSFVVDTGDGTNAPAGGINFNYFIVN